MISDADLARLQLAAYEYPDAAGVVTPFAWDWQVTLKTRPAGYKIAAGCCNIILPGTEDAHQWADDFDAVPYDHPTFGRIARGFWAGIEAFCDAFKMLAQPYLPIIVAGHSLGGAEAPLVAAELMRRGVGVARIVCFAPPRCGMQRLADYLRDVPKTLYQTRGAAWPFCDYVCDLPFDVPLVWPYVQIGPLTPLLVTPPRNDPWPEDPYHHMQLYAEAIR